MRNVESRNSLLIIQNIDIYGYKCETFEECKIDQKELTVNCNKRTYNILMSAIILLKTLS